MFALYFVDYTTIAKYSKVIGSLMVITALFANFFGITINRRIFYIGTLRMQATAFMMFYIPIYGGIIYKYRGDGLGSFARAFVWIVVPVFLVFRFPSIIVAGIMFISMLVQLTIAVKKGWFRLPIKRTIISMWIIAIVLPLVQNPSIGKLRLCGFVS